MRGHPRHGEALGGVDSFGEIAAIAPVGVGHDRLAADFVERDVLRGMFGGGGDRQGAIDALGIARRPLQDLHSAHRAAGDAKQHVDAEVVDEHRLGPNHVGDGDQRQVESIGGAGRRIGRGRPGGSHAAADDIGADDEETERVDRLARTDHRLPPAVLAGHRVLIGDVLVAGQRVADEDRIGFGAVEHAVGLIGDAQRSKLDAGVHLQRAIGSETKDQAMGSIGFARPIRQVEILRSQASGSSRSRSVCRTSRLIYRIPDEPESMAIGGEYEFLREPRRGHASNRLLTMSRRLSIARPVLEERSGKIAPSQRKGRGAS